jgi:peptidoglycan hydrolase-like amidase
MLAIAIAATVRIGVFGLFHPVQLEVKPAHGQVLRIEAPGPNGAHGTTRFLEGTETARLQAPALVTGRDGGEAAFVLRVPGKISREFHGRLEILQQGGHLTAIVEMDLETAVASIVAAEGSDATPVEAQKAQAVAARSFLVAARGKHPSFDFCDTTHCQFLREAPGEKSTAFRSTSATRGQVLTYQGRVVAALYSADCGGRTRTLAESEWSSKSAGGYPFFAVECPVKGTVKGHRVGMCQVGSGEMARRGATFVEILRHYFPATVIAEVQIER